MAKPSMDDYVDVAERIAKFYEQHPDGRLTRLGEPKLMEVGNKLFVQYTALAYRTPDDPKPCVGTAWEPFPGPTAFTRDSELMNAETSAWGRAIIAAGIPSKKIASAQEVNARNGASAPAKTPEPIKSKQAGELFDAARSANIDAPVLQRAVAHLAGKDLGELPDRDTAVTRLVALDADQADKLAQWIIKKAKEPSGA